MSNQSSNNANHHEPLPSNYVTQHKNKLKKPTNLEDYIKDFAGRLAVIKEVDFECESDFYGLPSPLQPD